MSKATPLSVLMGVKPPKPKTYEAYRAAKKEAKK